ncbi:CLUMA_CG015966, isoform A [Clunio marinus]|uniref:CLUMA_CG015966, isoform A n=1 Tax=Clunio marinus TaxID=568069 RepID=A0A1J1IR54_9DIPT|nr:CLUMA_CG015966, isoform A [Clunio marinus]
MFVIHKFTVDDFPTHPLRLAKPVDENARLNKNKPLTQTNHHVFIRPSLMLNKRSNSKEKNHTKENGEWPLTQGKKEKKSEAQKG